MEEFKVAFHFLDWFWTVTYLVLMVGCGLLFYRLGKRSESDFFLAGRGLPWWLPATSVYATHTATDTPMWIGGIVYKQGLRGLWYTMFGMWCAISAFVSTRIFRRSLAMSMAEWQGLRYSGMGAELLRGWLAGWQVFMNMFVLGWVGMAMGKVCHLVFGWPDWVGLVAFSSLCAIYVLSAGYWGVIMTDFQQGVIAFLVICIVCVWGIMYAGGPSNIIDKINGMGQGWRLNPFAFTGWTSGDFPILWFITMLVMAVIGGVGMGNFIDWYPEAQRIQSAATVRDAAYSIWGGGLLVLTRNSLWAVAMLGFFILNPNITEVSTYELGWYQMAFENLPVGMVGFFFAAVLAIHFSTIASHLNLGASYFTRDLYHHYVNPQAEERKLVWIGRLATFILLVGSFFMGSLMKDITSWLIFALWLQAAGIWLPSILQVVWWRFNSWGYLSSWIANLGISWLVVWVLPAFGVLPKDMPDYQQFWLLMLLTFLIYIPVTFLTKPDDEDHLVKYYAMTRPIGWWGPIHRKAVEQGLIKDIEPEAGVVGKPAPEEE